MALPKEPRQMMINMMYLVLTALLAMNVSAEILRAFKIVNETLEKTGGTIAEKNGTMYKQFDKEMQNDPKKTEIYFKKAKEVQKTCKELYEDIAKLKSHLIDKGGNNNGKEDEEEQSNFMSGKSDYAFDPSQIPSSLEFKLQVLPTEYNSIFYKCINLNNRLTSGSD